MLKKLIRNKISKNKYIYIYIYTYTNGTNISLYKSSIQNNFYHIFMVFSYTCLYIIIFIR